MMESAFFEDAPSPGSHIDLDAVEFSLSTSANGDEGHPFTEVVINSSND